jgi:hypothetical protein
MALLANAARQNNTARGATATSATSKAQPASSITVSGAHRHSTTKTTVHSCGRPANDMHAGHSITSSVTCVYAHRTSLRTIATGQDSAPTQCTDPASAASDGNMPTSASTARADESRYGANTCCLRWPRRDRDAARVAHNRLASAK